MGREMAVIKGAEVKSVHVGESYITVTIRIPLKSVFSVAKSRNPKPTPAGTKRANKAWEARNKGLKNG